LTALAAGGAAALVSGGDRRDSRGAAADPVLKTAQRGESGLTLRQEEVAVAAVDAHLRDAGVQSQLSDIRLYPLIVADEIVVCGLLPVGRAGAMQVVARVVLNQPTAAARASAARNGHATPHTRTAMVILEAGPGLGRGGSREGPGLRYCRHPEVAGGAAEATSATAAVQAGAEAATAPAARVVVVAPVRVRAAPASDAAILWTAPRGRSYVVLGQAPGAWIHIGDGQTALGWAHSSLFAPSP
jgi:hypothetical protein